MNMLIFIILILFLIVFFLALFVPVKIFVVYNRKCDIYIGYLFLKINILGKKSKNQKKANNNYKNKSFNKKTKKYIDSFVKIVKIRKIIIKIIKELVKNISFEKAYIDIKIASSEAKNCAMNSYIIRTFVYYLINLSEIKNNIKSMNISIFPSFLEENSKVKLDLTLKFVPIFIICAFIKILIAIKSK